MKKFPSPAFFLFYKKYILILFSFLILSQMLKLLISKKITIFSLIVIGLISLSMKLYLIDFSLPETGDNWIYVLRGIAHSQGVYYENPWQTSGWTLLLSPFFMLNNSNIYVDYVNITRILSIIISSLTIIPVYLLARKFFTEKYSIVMVALFAFQPQLNYITSFGYSEPLFLIILFSITAPEPEFTLIPPPGPVRSPRLNSIMLLRMVAP